MKINNLFFSAVCVAALYVGCQSRQDEGIWSKATEDVLVQRQLQKIVRCPLLSERRTPQVLSIGEIKNDTTVVSNDNMEFMKATIASELANSGMVIISAAKKRQTSSPQGGNAIAPTLMLCGKLTQRDSRGKDGNLLHEFTLELSIVEISTGLRIWNGKSMVGISANGRI